MAGDRHNPLRSQPIPQVGGDLDETIPEEIPSPLQQAAGATLESLGSARIHTAGTPLASTSEMTHSSVNHQLRRMQHVEVGEPLQDAEEDATMELDVAALRLGLERPAEKRRKMPTPNKTTPVDTRDVQRLVEQHASGGFMPFGPDSLEEPSLEPDPDDSADMDRTIEADLSVLSQSMMALRGGSKPRKANQPIYDEAEVQRQTFKVDIQHIARRLSAELSHKRQQETAEVDFPEELGSLAMELATDVVSKRAFEPQTTVRGDMSQLANQIAQRISEEHIGTDLAPQAQRTMNDFALELAANLEKEAMEWAAINQQEDASRDTQEVSPEAVLERLTPDEHAILHEAPKVPVVPNGPAPGAELDDLMGFAPVAPQQAKTVDLLAQTVDLDRDTAERSPAALGLMEKTVETGPGDAVQAAIARALADSKTQQALGDSLPNPPTANDTITDNFPPRHPAPSPVALSLELPAPPPPPPAPPPLVVPPSMQVPPTKKRSKAPMIIVGFLLFLTITLATAAALLYFFK